MTGKAKPVLIIGAGVAGGIVAEVLGKSQNRDFEPIGFVDDDTEKQKQVLYGLSVLGTRDDIPALVNRHNIKEIIIAIPSASGQVIAEIIEICHQTRTRLKRNATIPPSTVPMMNTEIRSKTAATDISPNVNIVYCLHLRTFLPCCISATPTRWCD